MPQPRLAHWHPLAATSSRRGLKTKPSALPGASVFPRDWPLLCGACTSVPTRANVQVPSCTHPNFNPEPVPLALGLCRIRQKQAVHVWGRAPPGSRDGQDSHPVLLSATSSSRNIGAFRVAHCLEYWPDPSAAPGPTRGACAPVGSASRSLQRCPVRRGVPPANTAVPLRLGCAEGGAQRGGAPLVAAPSAPSSGGSGSPGPCCTVCSGVPTAPGPPRRHQAPARAVGWQCLHLSQGHVTTTEMDAKYLPWDLTGSGLFSSQSR